MSAALVVGLGSVGVRAARQLADTDGVELLLADRNRQKAEHLAESMRARAVVFAPGDRIPDGVGVVATALPAGADRAIVDRAIEQGVSCASADDDYTSIERLRARHDAAARAGVTLALGCGLAPGLVDVLARHAADSFDAVDEIRIARTGVAGHACAVTARAARRAPALDWSGGAWHRQQQRRDEELVWFPDPIGARDCCGVAAGIGLLVEAFPAVERISVLLDATEPRSRWQRRRGDAAEWGAARVEVYGRRGDERDIVVYGVVERTAVAAGTVLGVTAAGLAGALTLGIERHAAAGLASLVQPVAFLSELARRGVRSAVFEGVPVA